MQKKILREILSGRGNAEADSENKISWREIIFETTKIRARGEIFRTDKDGIALINADFNDNFISDSAANILKNALLNYRYDLIPFFLKETAKFGKVLAPQNLPGMLEYCSENIKLNLLLSKVIGEAGRQLADLHPLWHSWYTDEKKMFAELSKEQKLQFLRRLREKDLAEQTNFIREVCVNEPTSFKVDILKITAQNLKKSDLNYLTLFFSDKAAQVRAAVQPLLSACGDTETAERAEKYFSECTDFHRGRIFTRIPAQCSAEMKKDGFSDKISPQEWTFRLFAGVSPIFIERFFQSEGADLLSLLLDAQYSDSALSGFMYSIKLRHDQVRAAQTLAALYAQKNKALFIKDLELIEMLDATEAEKIAEYYLKVMPPDEHFQYHPVSRLIAHYAADWSEKLTQTFVKALQKKVLLLCALIN